MNKAVVIIDDVKEDWASIASELHSMNCKFFPTKEEYSEIRSLFFKILSSTNKQEEIGNFKSWLSTNEIEPVMFIIDISLNGLSDNIEGLELGKELEKYYGNSVSIVFVSSFDITLIEGLVKKEDFIFKKELSTRLPEVLLEKGLVILDINPAITDENFQYNKGIVQQADYSSKLVIELQKSEFELETKLLTKKIVRNKKKILRLSNSEYWLSYVIHFIFKTIIIASIVFLLFYALVDIIIKLFSSPKEINGFVIVEHLFLSPLPLIISITFYNFYIQILEPILQKEKRDTSTAKRASMLDINISKYLFISIIFSTLLVVMTEFIKNSTEKISINNESKSNIIFKTDSLNKLSDTVSLSTIKNSTIGDLRKQQAKALPNNNFTITTFIFCGIFLILLVFYLFKLEKSITESKK